MPVLPYIPALAAVGLCAFAAVWWITWETGRFSGYDLGAGNVSVTETLTGYTVLARFLENG